MLEVPFNAFIQTAESTKTKNRRGPGSPNNAPIPFNTAYSRIYGK
jgi:hypothetical protein